jgi:hypothetical protein
MKMVQARFASIVLVPALVLVSASNASAQTAYTWGKYTLSAYGVIDVGYTCDHGWLSVAVHGESKGSLGIALGSDDPKPFAFDGHNAMGPDGYYAQALLRKSVECDSRQAWPLVSITANGQTLTIHWQ